ncbi:arylsulfatase [Methylocapsa acidiphila]|uniref:arylsulfatase n=1 Tax=Methylocapsa acidiphila TaxID=133552 RepID=UPI00055D70BB|nr:arylsulfatase [Methylocapsa acidiphila]
MKKFLCFRAMALALGLIPFADAASRAEETLPKPSTPFQGKIADTREQSVPAFPASPRAPADAPNIVLILLDDVGFGAAATFGGPAATSELDRLAAGGLRYNQFHTTAICSPTRAALLTGRNHHQTGFGNLADVAAGYPAYNSIWPKETASIAEILRLNGYSTAAFGKWHNTPDWEINPAGPFNHWPTGLGFEYYYGFMFGETSQWEPTLYRNTTPVDAPKKPEQGYHLTTDLVDDAIHWLHQHDAVASEKPFFLYFATGATHAPHHVPKEWIAKYSGQFDQGWDRLREETFARQKKLGVIPANTELTPRPDGLPAWDSLTADQKKLYAHQMEVYSAFLSQTDYEVGRLLRSIADSGKADNTLVIYVVGDNGGSAEGGLEGSDANFATLTGSRDEAPEMLSHLSDLGSPLYDNHYAAGWSWATTAPFQWMKQIASHFGGTRDGLVISWPGHTKNADIVRSQFSHVNDVAPTIYEAAGIVFPDKVDGAAQIPLEGKSLVASFADPAAKSLHTKQYFEIFGNRAIYKDGWVAGARHYAPWELFTDISKVFRGGFENDRWELYNVAEDFSEAHDLAEKFPEKLRELKAEFDWEARRNGVYPLVPLPVGAPSPVAGKSHFVYLSGVERLPGHAVPDVGGRSHRLTAYIDASEGPVEGVIVAQGGRYGGYSLFVKDGKLIYEANTFGKIHETLESAQPLPLGKARIDFVFEADPRPASGLPPLLAPKNAPGTGRLFVDGVEVAQRRFSKFGSFGSAITEPFDVGKDSGSAVSQSYETPFAFTGRVEKIEIDLQPAGGELVRR